MLNLKKLKKIRQAKGFTQRAFAEKIGVASPHYSNIENGKRGFSTETLTAILQVLEIKIDDLWDNTDGSLPPIFPVRDDGIIVEKTKYILPNTPETYKLIVDQVTTQDINSGLLIVTELWSKADAETREKILDLLKENTKGAE